jgi:putative tRNA adenosine deaminase-associated protein
MSTHDDFDSQLADAGDDRPGIDELDDVENLDDDDFDDDYDDDYPEDAGDDEIDLVIALYAEEGNPVAVPLVKDLANDLDGLVEQLRRMPGDAGVIGVVSIDSDFFVVVRVRGKRIQVLLSDVTAATDWPIARDAADFLGEDIPDDDDDDSRPVGDFDMLADTGISELELEALCSDYDPDPEEIIRRVANRLGFGLAYPRAAETFGL